MFRNALRSSMSSAAMVMGLCATGLVFNWMVVSGGLITFISNMLLSMGNRVLILLTLNLLLLFMGCFIGSMQVLLMVGPLLLSIAAALGMTNVQIGVMAVFNLVIGLIVSMILGRLVWGAAKWLLLGLAGKAFTLEMFLAGAVLNAVPGIILHIVLIPVLIMALEKAGVIDRH